MTTGRTAMLAPYEPGEILSNAEMPSVQVGGSEVALGDSRHLSIAGCHGISPSLEIPTAGDLVAGVWRARQEARASH